MKVHIGSEIEKKYHESGLKITAFADMINTSERNVYSLFKREDVNASLLTKVSSALNFNFFRLYQQELPKKLLEEPLHEYKNNRKVSMSFTITGDSEVYYKNFSSLLKKLTEEASHLGFKII